MRNVDLMNDLIPPVAIAALNIATKGKTIGTPSTTNPNPMTWGQAINYGAAVIGYAAGYMNFGGQYNNMLKNLGIAALPAAIIQLYNKMNEKTTGYVPTTIQRVSRYPAPAGESPFQGVRLV